MSSVSRERVANASTIRGIMVLLARICPSWTIRMALMRSEGDGLQQDPRAPASSARTAPSPSAAARTRITRSRRISRYGASAPSLPTSADSMCGRWHQGPRAPLRTRFRENDQRGIGGKDAPQ